MNIRPWRFVTACCAVSLSFAWGGGDLLPRAHALDPYLHVYHPDHGYVPFSGGYGGGGYGLGYYGGWGGGMTVAAGQGMAAAGYGQAAADIGKMNLYNSEAQINHQAAVSDYLKNVGVAQETAIETTQRREQWEQQRSEEHRKQSLAQQALYTKSLQQMAAAHRLTAEQFDMNTGVLHWPFVLRGDQYTELRTKIDELFDARSPSDSGKDSSSYGAILQACQQMLEIVKKDVQNGMSVTDFVTANHFISSIQYEARFKVKTSN